MSATIYTLGDGVWHTCNSGLTGLQKLAGAREYHIEPFISKKATPKQALSAISRKYPASNFKLKNY